MATIAIRVDMPAPDIEISGGGSSLSDAEMEALQEGRREFLELVSPYLDSLPERPARRSGNVQRVELLGADTWPNLHHYLLLITVDIGTPDFAGELEALLPAGAEVAVIGDYDPLQTWPEDDRGQAPVGA